MGIGDRKYSPITSLALPGQGQRNAGVLAENNVSPWPRATIASKEICREGSYGYCLEVEKLADAKNQRTKSIETASCLYSI